MYVKNAFTYTYGHGGTVNVPAGARTTSASAHGDVDWRWVDHTVFPAGSIARHDAEHYGIRVPLDNITPHQRPAEPKSDECVWYRGWETGYSHDAAGWTGYGWYACLGGVDEDCEQITARTWAELLDEIEENEK